MNRLLLCLAFFFGIALAILKQGSEVHFYCANLTAVFTSAIGEWFSTPGITSDIRMSFFSTLTLMMESSSFFFIVFQLFVKPMADFYCQAIALQKDDTDSFCNGSVCWSGFSRLRGKFFDACVARFQLLGINNAGFRYAGRKFLSRRLSNPNFWGTTFIQDLTVKYSSNNYGLFVAI